MAKLNPMARVNAPQCLVTAAMPSLGAQREHPDQGVQRRFPVNRWNCQISFIVENRIKKTTRRGGIACTYHTHADSSSQPRNGGISKKLLRRKLREVHHGTTTASGLGRDGQERNVYLLLAFLQSFPHFCRFWICLLLAVRVAYSAVPLSLFSMSVLWIHVHFLE